MNPKRSRSQIVTAIVGFVMLAFSTPCVLAMLNDLFIAGTDNASGALIVGGFMAFVGLAGIVMMWTGLKKPTAAEFAINQPLERRVLSLARAHNGRITVAELALETELTLDQAREVLQHLEIAGVARTHLSDDGDIVYVFGGLTVDKDSAVDPLDEHAAFDAELTAAADEVQFERSTSGTDGNVEFDLDDEPQDQVATAQQQAHNEEW